MHELNRVGGKNGSGCSSFLLSSGGLEKYELVCPRTRENSWRRRDPDPIGESQRY